MSRARDPLPDQAMVLRVLKRTDYFFEAPDYRQPTPKAFEPTKEDLAEATVGVSVFDTAETTLTQAIAVREHLSGRPLGDVQALDLGVADARAVGRETGREVDVVSDPLDFDLPGAGGHALVLGLERREGESKASYKNRLSAVAYRAVVRSG